MGLECGTNITQISGNRAYVLGGQLFELKQALTMFAMRFMKYKKFQLKTAPVFMHYENMRDVCQLGDFDETLYELSDKSRGNKKTSQAKKKYLTATSEQFMVAYHKNTVFKEKELPKHYCAFNECFRKESGSLGKDTNGIFRVHQFDKFEQFVVCKPEDSQRELEGLLDNIKEFYDLLGIQYRVVLMDAADINGSTAIKYDLEAYFPHSKQYRELVSCSNCTSYQARKVNCKYRKEEGDEREFVHMLNSTLCAIQRTLCCLVEYYWNDETQSFKVPEVLQEFMV